MANPSSSIAPELPIRGSDDERADITLINRAVPNAANAETSYSKSPIPISTPGIDEVDTSENPPSVENRQRLAIRVEKMRHTLSSLRTDIGLIQAQERVSWERHERYERLYSDSRRDYEDLIRYRRSAAPTRPENLRVKRRQLNDDQSRLETQYNEAHGLQRQRFAMEREVDAMCDQFSKLVGELVVLTVADWRDSNVRLAAGPAKSTAMSESAASSAPRLDPHLELYYDRAGDVNIIAERLAELQQQYCEDIASRGLRQDRAEALSIADDDEFQKSYLREQGILETELSIAVKDADNLRDACIQAGINVDTQRDVQDDSDVYMEDSKSEPGITQLQFVPALLSTDQLQVSQLLDLGLKPPNFSNTPTTLNTLANAAKPRKGEDRALSNVELWIERLDTHSSEPIADALRPRSYSGSRSLPVEGETLLSGHMTPNTRQRPEPDAIIELLQSSGFT